jgi:hypothetical protein
MRGEAAKQLRINRSRQREETADCLVHPPARPHLARKRRRAARQQQEPLQRSAGVSTGHCLRAEREVGGPRAAKAAALERGGGSGRGGAGALGGGRGGGAAAVELELKDARGAEEGLRQEVVLRARPPDRGRRGEAGRHRVGGRPRRPLGRGLLRVLRLRGPLVIEQRSSRVVCVRACPKRIGGMPRVREGGGGWMDCQPLNGIGALHRDSHTYGVVGGLGEQPPTAGL